MHHQVAKIGKQGGVTHGQVAVTLNENIVQGNIDDRCHHSAHHNEGGFLGIILGRHDEIIQKQHQSR